MLLTSGRWRFRSRSRRPTAIPFPFTDFGQTPPTLGCVSVNCCLLLLLLFAEFGQFASLRVCQFASLPACQLAGLLFACLLLFGFAVCFMSAVRPLTMLDGSIAGLNGSQLVYCGFGACVFRPKSAA